MAESPRTARAGPGGFLPSRNSLPSPTPSTASSRVAALLPHPRSKPLVPGSKKEDYARDYVARRLLHISRRYVKKFGIPDPADEVSGYESMEEACRDLEDVVDVLWFSGTPSLQVPYLLNIALAFNNYLPSFPPVPRPTFALLRKLDHCFASLLIGYDVKTKEPLPGFTSTVDNTAKSRFSRTDMVRCKSLADETRMLVAVVMSGEVDVVDYAEDEDEDEVIARRPARARTEARSESVEAPAPTSHGLQGIETVKVEEMDDENSDLDFSSVDEEPTTPTKRKAEDISEDPAVADATEKTKRIKIEDDGDTEVNLSGVVPTSDIDSKSPAAVNSRDGEKAQFHWALDEEDSSSDSENEPSSAMSATKARGTSVVGEEFPSHHQAPGSNVTGEGSRRTDDLDIKEERALQHEDYDSDEEADEELQMNVGRVYQKTLVQLGQSLGESIIDD